jgi:hypothetical protein
MTLPSLGRNFSAFEGWLNTTTGLRFRGIIMPASESVSGSQILENRLLLKTRPNEPVSEGMLVLDQAGRPFLLGRDDTQLSEGASIAKTYRMFRMTGQYSWQRAASGTDTVTGLAKRTGQTEMGPIYAAIEHLSNLDVDRGTHMTSVKYQVITSAAVQLQDQIDNHLVRRITQVFGIYVCETE